jgi:hypothetical protein
MDCNAVSTELLQMLGSGIGGTTNLKRLHILLRIEVHQPESLRHHISMDVQALETLDAPSLQTLVLTVESNDTLRNNAQYLATLKEYI